MISSVRMRQGTRMRFSFWLIGLIALSTVGMPAPATAQSTPLEFGGLLRAGLRVEPSESFSSDGFDVYDARLMMFGKIGIIFDYLMQVEYDEEDDAFELLDARAGLPIMPEAEIHFGLFRPHFGLEALTDKGDLTFLERSQASEAIAPGRQVGVAVGGEAADARLTYGFGIFNGNGRTLDNDGDNFMAAGRAQFNSIGPIPFYEDLVFQVGASLAYSSDTAAELGLGVEGFEPGETGIGFEDAFAGDRLLWEVDAHVSYRGWSLTAEYLRGDYDPSDDFAGGVLEGEDVGAYGGYVEAGYLFWGGAIEAVARYDGFNPALGANRDFILLGINIFPGQYAKFGFQHAIDLHDSPASPFLAGGRFLFVAQVDF